MNELKVIKLVEDIISDFDSLETVGVFFDQNWQQIRETSHHPEYVRLEDLKELVSKWQVRDVINLLESIEIKII